MTVYGERPCGIGLYYVHITVRTSEIGNWSQVSSRDRRTWVLLLAASHRSRACGSTLKALPAWGSDTQWKEACQLQKPDTRCDSPQERMHITHSPQQLQSLSALRATSCATEHVAQPKLSATALRAHVCLVGAVRRTCSRNWNEATADDEPCDTEATPKRHEATHPSDTR